MELARHLLETEFLKKDLDKKVLIRNKSMLSVIFTRLGEFECWKNNYLSGIELFKKGLQLKNVGNDVEIAKQNYLIGNAYSCLNNKENEDLALEYFNEAKNLLEMKLLSELKLKTVKSILESSNQ